MKLIEIINYFLPSNKKLVIEDVVIEKPVVKLTEQQEELYQKELIAFEEMLALDHFKGVDKTNEENRVFNEICPKCKSTEVNDRIREKDFAVSVSASSYGFYGSSSNASVKRSVNPVNKCNSCGHEWEKVIKSYQSPHYYNIHLVETMCRSLDKKDWSINKFWQSILNSLTPYISVETFIFFRDRYDSYHIDWGEPEKDITEDKLKRLGFKTLEERYGRN